MNEPTTKNNGLLWVHNFGQRAVCVERINHGISIIQNASNLRHGKTTNFRVVTSGSFELSLVCTSFQEYRDLGEWLMAYGDKMSNPNNQVSAMRVTVPQFSFDKVAIPYRGVNQGDTVEAVVYRMTLAFAGTTDPVGAAYASKYVAPKVEDVAPFVYPGSQLKAGELTEDMYAEQANKAWQEANKPAPATEPEPTLVPIPPQGPIKPPPPPGPPVPILPSIGTPRPRS